MADFVHLHLHSQYSLLDGANRLQELLQTARECGMPAMALTDHGNMFGAVDFYKKARAEGVKPILGMEAYVAQGSRLERQPGRGSSNHLVLLARNATGYRNLIKLTSSSYLEGFYYKPRIDKELLRRHSEGLIGLSACLKGEVIEKILGRQEDEAEAVARDYVDIFGEGNFYLELQDHGMEEQRQANEVLQRLARKLGIPKVLTNDCHFLKKEDSFAHDVLLCIGTQKNLSDPDRLKYASDQFYLKTGDEMFATFPGEAKALENTLAIAERCAVEIPTGEFHLPEFPVPDGHELEPYFEQVATEGLEMRLAEMRERQLEIPYPADVYHERLRTEIEIIKDMGFPGYFMIVWDFIRHAKENDIPVGPGRGSAAGSLVAFALRITDIDPLKYNLFFERFLNPERVSLPDIDIDFCMRRRGEVIDYVNEKYGRDKVAGIITFGTLKAKALVRDVGRVMGIPYSKADRIAKMIPEMTSSLSEAAAEVDALRREVETDPEVRQIVSVGSRLEGITRHLSRHAAGVVIAPRPIDELVPLCKTNKDEVVTQWDMGAIEELGLLKMDFLGLKTLTVIHDTVEIVRHQGLELDLDTIPLDDAKTYELFREGRTHGIFQFESPGMKDLLRKAEPSKFEDLVAFCAIYRPGALSAGMVDTYIKRKLGKEKITYSLPETRPILEETHGVIVYQEQVMQIAVEVAGFTMGEADVLRKAMGKKKPEVMAEQKEKFLVGAEGRGVPRAKARSLWEHIEPFAGYGFNKSHSVAYTLLSFQTGYLKAHHPVAYMAAMLSSEMSTKDNVPKYIQECRQMGIRVLPPDVNESAWSFTVRDRDIRFSLGAVKGLGESAVEAILEARQRVGRFEDLAHFAREVNLKSVNHRAFESLIKAGCFDDLNTERGVLYAQLDSLLQLAQKRQRDLEVGQDSLFSTSATPEPKPRSVENPWSEKERLQYEKDALGFYLTGHPLSEHQNRLAALTSDTTGSLRAGGEGRALLGGIVTRLKTTKIKSGRNAGRMMGRFEIEDLEGTLPVAVFADTLQKCRSVLIEGRAVLVKGVARERGGDVEITLEEISSLDVDEDELINGLALDLRPEMSTAELMELRELLTENSGPIRVSLHVDLEGRRVRIAPQDRFKVNLDKGLVDSLEKFLGRGRVHKQFSDPSGP